MNVASTNYAWTSVPATDRLIVNEYPKSGGTWLVNVLGDALGRRKLGVEASRGQFIPALQNHPWYRGLTDVGMGKPCVMRGHEPPTSPLLDFPCTMIHLVRDARDVAVSRFHFEHLCSDLSLQKPLSETFAEYALKLASDWVTFVTAWQEAGASQKVVLVRYEDMLLDTPGVVKRTFEDCGYAVDDAAIGQAVMKNTKQNMRKELADSLGEQLGRFVRKGVAGDWVNHFDDKTHRAFLAIAKPTMISLGYEVQ